MANNLKIGFEEISRDEECEISGGNVNWLKVADTVGDILVGSPGTNMLIDIVVGDLTRYYVSGLYEGYYY